MSNKDKYTLKRIEQVKGKQVFEKLVINGTAPWDVFIDELEDKYRSEVIAMYKYMDVVANLGVLPGTKFHPYSDGKDGTREYEFKTKHLRAYAIEKPGGRIVIMGGKKSTQKDDQTEFRRLKKRYIDSL